MRRLLLAVVFALGCQAQTSTVSSPVATPTAEGSANRDAPVPVAARPTPPPEPPPPEPARTEPAPTEPAALARWLTDHATVVDGHVDLPWRLLKSAAADGTPTEDPSLATPTGDFDWPRAREGGLDAPFMSIYVASKFEGRGARAHADHLIDLVLGLAAGAPDKFALAPDVATVRRNAAAGLISLPMGMENGAPLEGDLANVTYFHGRGIRYITLTHSRDNHISDSSFDTRHTHGGLSAFGEQVVAEMNRVGVMVDVSHLSDQAFWDVMAASRAPVLATHSSCRHFTPNFERNMSDDMIRALAKQGGVIMINFGSDFLSGEVRTARDRHAAAATRALRKAKLAPQSPAGLAFLAEYDTRHPVPRATVEHVASHIEHVIGLVGVDHVGLGSDFDGVGDSLPQGLRHVGEYPNLVRVLLQRGRTAVELEKILGGNALRVWQAVEDHAATRR